MNDTLNFWAEFQDVSWDSVLTNPITLGSHYKIVPTEGYLVWEYNPLRNYRLNGVMYEKDGKYYTKEDLNITSSEEQTYLTNLRDYKNITNKESDEARRIKDALDIFERRLNQYTLHEPGELIDFITDLLTFDLSHPVEILPQYSYDGSVNLILNDGLNIPRLINTRFTVTGKNTYKVIDRLGDNDTNIYDLGAQFDVDTSLFKNVNKIPKLEYLGTTTGNMKIGNYHFYFKYADADGNESDWVAESGLVSVFIGNSPQSVNTGLRDENSIKGVLFKLSNIDIGYAYVKVYYSRYSGDIDTNSVHYFKKIEKNYLINTAGTCNILITGDEVETDSSLKEINESFDIILNAKTQCTAANRLFMANIHKSKIEYDLLSKLALCFCPYKSEEPYPLSDNGINADYHISSSENGYYDSKYIYEKTGYWPGELYRIGIVYILKDGSLSPVFNIRGATKIPIKSARGDWRYKVEQDFESGKSIKEILDTIDYSEESFLIAGDKVPYENAKGVILLDSTPQTANISPFPVYGIHITADKLVINELKKYTKGFFFVRQKRMPLTLCLGIVVGLDKESKTPTLPTLEGVLTNIETDNSFVESEDINDINYVSEGFLSRYYFKLKPKKSNYLKKIGIALGTVVVLAAAAVATVFTCGAAGVLFGVGVAALISSMTPALITIGVTAAVAFAGAASVITNQTLALKARLARNKKQAKAVKGRNEPITEGYERKEQDESRKLTHELAERYIIKDPTCNSPSAIIVPDYLVNMPYYNQFLTGEKFKIQLTYELPLTSYLTDGYFESKDRHFYVDGYKLQSDNRIYTVNLVGVPDGCPIKMIQNDKYRARAGYPEEAYKYEFIGTTYEDTEDKIANSDIIRGNFGSFVGMKGYEGHVCDLINIMIPGYLENKLYEYLQLRAQDTSTFHAISDRIDINELNKQTSFLQQVEVVELDFNLTCYRGDCYICQYTHRINRNFNDPSAPYNDIIISPKSWKDNYNPDKTEKYADINLGDVNAVLLGLWLTFWVRSSYNLNIRTIDKSNIDEFLMCGNYRSFYPHYGQLADGNLKIPDSSQYNKGFSKSVSEKYYFEVPDVPYIKLEFLNRIVFSDIHVNDAYKNGFRVIRTLNHKDYPMTYGSITKIIEYRESLLIVFEHGIGLVGINNLSEHPSQILSNLNIISDTYGSQWKDSIIKTPSGVYGVDTIAKKIWRVVEGLIDLISNLKVQEFLNQNISLSERELTPIIGIRNVKTFYNNFKHDVMFTFYDNLYGIHEKSWNLCWNEVLQIFTTFYSWIPSNMENIDNIPFSFDRETVKAIAKLGISDHGNNFSDGITLTNNVLLVTKSNDTYSFDVLDYNLKRKYLNHRKEWCEYNFITKEQSQNIPIGTSYLEDIVLTTNFIGFLNLDNRVLPDDKYIYKIEYELLRDSLKNYTKFKINTAKIAIVPVNELFKSNVEYITVSYLTLDTNTKVETLLSELYYRNKENIAYADYDDNKIKPIKNQDKSITIHIDKPIFKNLAGKRLMLDDQDKINKDSIIRYLNIRAKISIGLYGIPTTAEEAYYSQFTTGDEENNVCMIDAGYFESQVAITTDFNLSLLSTDFWKHGLAGIIDISEKIYPTLWYGKQHPFEFECVVSEGPNIHKIFTNLELVSNKVQPKSFHYEVVGDAYDFAEDKPTMYFRQEALKALYQYNGYNIEYNSNFRQVEPKQHNKSADLPKYYFRLDTINEIYDSYKRIQAPQGFNYDHLAGAEIVYYPTRNEFRVWNHVQAINVDSYDDLGIETSIIKANCRYLEDKWLISINPIIVTYKNEFDKVSSNKDGQSMFTKENGQYIYSSWVGTQKDENKPLLPPLTISNLQIKDGEYVESKTIEFPQNGYGKENSLYGLYDLNAWNSGNWRPIDPNRNVDRRETDVRGKLIKIRITYSGTELAIIDFLNTIYQISIA